GSPKHFVNAMCSGSLETLQNFDKRERPTILIAKRPEQEMNVVGHYHDCMQVNSRSGLCHVRLCGAGALAREGRNAAFSQAVLQYQVTSFFWKDLPCTSAESDEQICIGLLQMRQPAAIFVFGQ